LTRQRTAKELIDDAIRENSTASFLLYCFAIAFVCVGLAILITGVVKNNEFIGLIGALSSAMFWPAMRSARKTRRENISIRLLEAPLSKAATSDEAAKMLQGLFENIFSDTPGD